MAFSHRCRRAPAGSRTGGHRLVVGAVTEGDRLPYVGSWRAISAPTCSGLRWPGPRLLPTYRLARRGHLEHGLGREHVVSPRCPARTGASGVKTCAQLGYPHTRSHQHRRVGNIPVAARSQLHPQLRLGLEPTSSGIFAFLRRSASEHHSSGRYSAQPNGTVPLEPTACTDTPIEARSSPTSPSTDADTASPCRPSGTRCHPAPTPAHRSPPPPAPRPTAPPRRIPRTIRHELLQRLIVRVTAKPIDQRLKRSEPPARSAPANTSRLAPCTGRFIASASTSTPNAAKRSRTTEGRSTLRSRCEPAQSHHHHDLPAFDDNREKGSPQ